MKKRIDFSATIIRKVRDRAAYICSKPDCRVSTIAPSKDNPEAVIYIGKVAHIYGASINGPRGNLELGERYISSIENAIFLCSNCATEIDNNNGAGYSPEILREWKAKHEDWVSSTLNKPVSDNRNTYSQSNINQRGGIAANNINIKNFVLGNEPEITTHDKNIFLESSKLLDEKLLLRNLRLINGTTTIPVHSIYPLHYYYEFFSLVSNNYLDPDIESKNRQFIESIEEFWKHIRISYARDLSTESYRPVKGGPLHYNLFMLPELSDNPIKEQATKQRLNELGSILKINYGIFRRDVKMKLFI